MKAEVVGLNVLTRRLSEAAKAAKRAADETGTAAAERVASAIRARVPVDRGGLRDSVRTEAAPDGGTIVRVGGTPETTKQAAGGTVDEAVLAEFGTGHSEAHPFWFSTLDEQRSSVVTEMADAAAAAAARTVE